MCSDSAVWAFGGVSGFKDRSSVVHARGECNVFRLQIDGRKPGAKSPKSSVGQAVALGRPQGRRPPASSSFCHSSYSVAYGCVTAVSASMVTSESSVFSQGQWSLDQGYLTPGTNPPALELKTIKQREKVILENLSLNISICSQDYCLTRKPRWQAGGQVSPCSVCLPSS